MRIFYKVIFTLFLIFFIFIFTEPVYAVGETNCILSLPHGSYTCIFGKIKVFSLTQKAATAFYNHPDYKFFGHWVIGFSDYQHNLLYLRAFTCPYNVNNIIHTPII